VTNQTIRIIPRLKTFYEKTATARLPLSDSLITVAGWLITWLFLVVAVDRDFPAQPMWLVFHFVFWFRLNQQILKKLNPPAEITLVLSLMLLPVLISFTDSLVTLDPSVGSLFVQAPVRAFFQQAIQLVLLGVFGWIIVANTQHNQALIFDARNFGEQKIRSFTLINYALLMLLGYHVFFSEDITYLYLFQFILFLVLLKKTIWVELLSRLELWIYFAIFLLIFFFSNPRPDIPQVSFNESRNLITHGLPLFLALLIRMYLLALLVKIPLVMVYNHASLSRKLQISGIFQSSVPLLIQFVLLVSTFYFFLSAWQADRLRSGLSTTFDHTNGHMTIRPATDDSLNLAGYRSQKIRLEKDHFAVIQLQPDNVTANPHYFLVRAVSDSAGTVFELAPLQRSLLDDWYTSATPFSGSGLYLYPFTPLRWQRPFYTWDYWREDNGIGIFPFALISQNDSSTLRTSSAEQDSSRLKVVLFYNEIISASKRPVMGRVFLPLLNNPDAPYMACDLVLIPESNFFTSITARMMLALLIFYLVLNAVVIRRVVKFGEGINATIIQKFNQLKQGIREISSGNLDYTLNIEGEDEFFELGERFNQMGYRLRQTIEQVREKDRLDQELKIARQVQLNLLPGSLPKIAGYNLDASLQTAHAVGGDLYDVLPMGNNRYLLTVGDVSGKGSSAAFYMAQFMSLLRYSTQFLRDAGHIAQHMNDYFHAHVQDRQIFVTAIIGILDTTNATFEMVRAGHTPAIFIPANPDEPVRDLSPKGLGIGLTGDKKLFRQGTEVIKTLLQPGDKIILYTDGLTEAAVPGKEFGDPRFRSFLSENRQATAAELVTRVEEEVAGFYGEQPRVDDHTLLVIERLATKE
jgi:serine phosphatase RsbU (regulator of sigma subunit)